MQPVSSILDSRLNGPLVDVFSYLDPKDLSNFSQTCKKTFRNRNLTAENSIWRVIAKYLDCILPISDQPQVPGDVKKQVREYVLDIKRDIKKLHESLPSDIDQIVESNKAPSFEEIGLLKKYRTARDTLIVWNELANQIHLSIPLSSDEIKSSNSDQFFEKIKEFSSWCTEHQNELNRLSVLQLANKQLTSLPLEIWNFFQLKCLKIPKNQLTYLPSEIGNLFQLITLDISGNQLTELPPEIAKLSQLKYLFAQDNKLRSLFAEIGKLSLLQLLCISKNRLTGLPPEIGKLSQLEILYASENKITSLPIGIGNLSKLVKLSISVNQLTCLHQEIKTLSQLKEFFIFENLLTNLPPEIGNLSQLKILKISHNRLTSLPSEIGNLSLDILDVSNNPISFFERSLFFFKTKKVKIFPIAIGIIGIGLAIYFPDTMRNGLEYTAAAVQNFTRQYFNL